MSSNNDYIKTQLPKDLYLLEKQLDSQKGWLATPSWRICQTIDRITKNLPNISLTSEQYLNSDIYSVLQKAHTFIQSKKASSCENIFYRIFSNASNKAEKSLQTLEEKILSIHQHANPYEIKQSKNPQSAYSKLIPYELTQQATNFELNQAISFLENNPPTLDSAAARTIFKKLEMALIRNDKLYDPYIKIVTYMLDLATDTQWKNDTELNRNHIFKALRSLGGGG